LRPVYCVELICDFDFSGLFRFCQAFIGAN